MNCPNCGFPNAPGDQFCGSCGSQLQPAPAAAAGPTSATGPVQATSGFEPDVICWKCGRRNPSGRSFCMQCGEKLEAAALATSGVGSATVGARDTRVGGTETPSGRGRLLAMGAAVAVVLLVVAVGAAALLNRPGPPGPIAVIVESPSPSAAVGSPLPTAVATLPPAEPTANAASPSPSPGAGATPTPPATSSPSPTHTPRPTGTPTSPPTATPLPTPVTCADYTGPSKWFDLNPGDERTIPAGKDWCIVSVTFTNASVPGASGSLQIFLNNPTAFYDFDAGFYYGWLSANISSDFPNSDQYSPKVKYPKGYMEGSLWASTVVKFDIPSCGTNGTCSGSVHVVYQAIPAQPR
jgi:hypothetical protein